MAGLACGAALTRAGHRVSLFDKGRRPGGRMSTRQIATPLGDAGFDYGAQYFTARDPDFQRQVAAWQAAGLAAPWPAAGAQAWVGTPGMDAPVAELARHQDVQWSVRIEALDRQDGRWRLAGAGVPDEAFDVVLLAVPAENAAPLVARWGASLADLAQDTPAAPCWTVMAAFAERLPIAADTLEEAGPIGWATRNSAKPGRTGLESWVIQAGPAWSAQHLEQTPQAVLPLLMAAFSELAGALPEPLAAVAHRWRYARSGSTDVEMVWDAGLGLGLCGDWLIGPRVECAWVSGTRLAEAVGGLQPGL